MAPPTAQPDRAMLILASAVAEILGSGSIAFQRIVLAAGTRANDDRARARDAFDRLPGAQRRAVKGKAETAAVAWRQRAVLRTVLKNLPQWRPENVEWVWPRSQPAPAGSSIQDNKKGAQRPPAR